MDTAQWPQDIVMKPMEEIIVRPNITRQYPKLSNNCLERSSKVLMSRPQKEQALNCPRCNSTNTKFCYYNNYSLSQPRYFCKTCRRYWTQGGSLRNIPVGGGSRKNNNNNNNNRIKSSSSSSSTTTSYNDFSKKVQNPNDTCKNDHLQESKHLNLELIPNTNPQDFKNLQLNPSPPPPPPSSFVPAFYNSSGFLHLSEFKQSNSLNSGFLDQGLGNNYGSFQGVQETSGKHLFPFQGLKQRTNDDAQQIRDQNGAGYWSGVIGGGSWSQQLH